jgi:DNA-binding LytR/AlgR family response regulator
MIKAIIVDDEPLAQDVLETYIEKLPEITLIAKCSNALEANNCLKTEDVDLMFLDIQMPQLTGIDFLKTLSNPPIVIFTTAYPNYALEGFELNALDYLLKPISLERFMKAVNKAIEKIELQRKDSSSGHVSEDEPDFIFVKADKKLVKIHYQDIIYIEGLKDYVIIRMNNSRVITLQTMKSLEEKLPKHIFKRIHRSYIVNIDKIDAVIGNMIEVKEKDQAKHLPIGKNYRDELLAIVNKNRL